LLTAEQELDEIYTLMAYAVVYKDWQVKGPSKRGHNIGCVLVDPDGEVVHWARNCNAVTKNGTMHGEVRCIQGYINKRHSYSLKGHTIYTSLEPCAQCSGMMTLASIKRTVYGQTDPGFGKAIERLQLDSTSLPTGYKPYPRGVISARNNNVICGALEKGYAHTGGSITGYLLMPAAKALYKQGAGMFLGYKVKFPDNQPKYQKAVQFYATVVSSKYVPLPAMR